MGKWFNNLVKMIDEENKKNPVLSESISDTETVGEKAEEELNEPTEPDEPPEPDEPKESIEPNEPNESNEIIKGE